MFRARFVLLQGAYFEREFEAADPSVGIVVKIWHDLSCGGWIWPSGVHAAFRPAASLVRELMGARTLLRSAGG